MGDTKRGIRAVGITQYGCTRGLEETQNELKWPMGRHRYQVSLERHLGAPGAVKKTAITYNVT